ncbi:probable calcium-binding CML45 [Olea europaea subsp. europaea]|uniref:Probable calcium-binding CML45 n=1 Tax=Olea europaea subsp. europaea TaxID=158383 RepID=A0A8S0RVB5_OLEEU|nr:probable calcium-binding CML45 [Olea europaea subsp. europaea]
MGLTQKNTISSSIVILFKVLWWDIKDFFSSVHFFLQTFPRFFPTKWNLWRKSNPSNKESRTSEASNDENFHITELNMLITRLGIEYAEDGGDESFSIDEFAALFNEEPSLQEIKETFDVFNDKKDGFIDANELQRVQCSLGLKEGCDLEQCRRMIKAFDGNGDGVIDFYEFVKFMEKCLC